MSKKIDHPLFRYTSDGPWQDAPKNLKRSRVFVFERPRLITPTAEQIAEYHKSRRIVESLGGHMNKLEHEIAGESQPLSSLEVAEMVAAVLKKNPAAKLIKHWNGEGCYTLSVGVDMEGAIRA